ncbi:MAG TPA: hypothetical protein PKN80_02740 [bacterium]|nr:hypothetical protein [bacterium]HNS48612.1 hypothetical protein [bacterium]
MLTVGLDLFEGGRAFFLAGSLLLCGQFPAAFYFGGLPFGFLAGRFGFLPGQYLPAFV